MLIDINNLKKIRENAGYTQKQLANILNTTVRTVSRWENRKSRPSFNHILKLNEIFNRSE